MNKNETLLKALSILINLKANKPQHYVMFEDVKR